MTSKERMEKLMYISEIGVDMNKYLKVRKFSESLTDDLESTKYFDEAVDFIYRVFNRVEGLY